MQKITDQFYTKQDVFILFAKLFERCSYYGLRAILILYLIDGARNMTKDEALYHYGLFTTGVLIFGIVGAIVGDFILGNKKSLLIGGILQTMGAFILSSPSVLALYIGLGFVIVGGGLFVPNLFSCFGKSYSYRLKLLDSAFSTYYLIINLGAALGIYTIGLIGEKHGWAAGFMLSGLFMFVSLIFSFLHEESENNSSKYPHSYYDLNIKYSIISFIAFGLFWAVNDLVYDQTLMINHSFSENISYLDSSFWSSINTFLMIPISVILASVWAYYYSNSFTKLSVGFLFAAVSYGLLILIPDFPNEQHLPYYLISIFCFVVSEAFIGPIIYSIITRYMNPKYLATAASMIIITNKFFFYIGGISKAVIGSNTFLLIAACSVCMILLSVLVFLFKDKDEPNKNSDFLDSFQKY